MLRATTITVLAAIAVTLGAGCGDDDDDKSASTTATQPEAVPAVVKVSIGDNTYEPSEVTIVRGQSISWRNDGAVAHTVTSDEDSAVKFDSGTLEPRGAYALKPTGVGELTYFCTIHGKSQSGKIIVTR